MDDLTFEIDMDHVQATLGDNAVIVFLGEALVGGKSPEVSAPFTL